MTKWILPLALLLCGSVQAQTVDPTGFTEQLNVVRHSLSLPLVSFGPTTVGIAQTNNAGMRAGAGPHNFTGGLAQCSAQGSYAVSAAASLSAWIASPAHNAIIMSPALVSVGYATDGYCATVACTMGQPAIQPALPHYYSPTRRGLFRRFR
jgi:uncharacterized protein YkwD